MEDNQIIDLYWARDQRAIDETSGKYGGFLLQLAWNILRSHADAEECVNDTWHRAWNTMPPQRPASLRAYLVRLVRNLSIDRWRARKSQKRGEGLEALVLELEDCVPAVPSAEEETEARELSLTIDRWLDGLPREDRVLFVRRYWYGQRLDELSGQLGWSPNRVSQRLLRLRTGLKRYLEREGVVL